MKVIGVICEYNPFHNGHQRQFACIRRQFGQDAAIVCLMSGDFSQRGECAVFSKEVRAAAAVDCGADLVLCLPVSVSLSSAEGFASGAVDLFDRLGGVDALCFGSETADTEKLVKTAKLLCSEEYKAAFRTQIDRGISYAAARQAALACLGADAGVLEKPNDILAVEYCKALIEKNSRITPFAVHRAGDYHAETPDTENPSAQFIRSLLPEGDVRPFVPQAAAKHYEKADCHFMKTGEKAMLARFFSMRKDEWDHVPFSSEGLGNCVFKAVQSEQTVDAVIEKAKSKRYVRTRLCRLLLCAFLGLRKEDLSRPIPYLRVLSFSETGGKLLKQMRRTGSVLLLNAGEKADFSDYSETENRTERLYSLFSEQNETQDTVLTEKSRIYYKKM